MDREEILAKSRNENKGLDEREKASLKQAGSRAYAVGGMVCMAVILLSAVFDRFGSPATYAAWAVYLSMAGTTFVTKYGALQKKHELILGCFYLVLAAVFLVLFVLKLTGAR